jgi:hypothetical protein
MCGWRDRRQRKMGFPLGSSLATEVGLDFPHGPLGQPGQGGVGHPVIGDDEERLKQGIATGPISGAAVYREHLPKHGACRAVKQHPRRDGIEGGIPDPCPADVEHRREPAFPGQEIRGKQIAVSPDRGPVPCRRLEGDSQAAPMRSD